MALKFDITGNPPEQALITAELEQANEALEVLRKQNRRFLIWFVSIILVYATFMLTVVIPILGDPTVVPDLVATFAYFLPYVTFFIFFVGNHLHTKRIDRPKRAAKNTIKVMTEATAEELAPIAGSEKKYQLIADYRDKTSALARGLTKGELDLLAEWVEDREREEKGIKKPSVHELTL